MNKKLFIIAICIIIILFACAALFFNQMSTPIIADETNSEQTQSSHSAASDTPVQAMPEVTSDANNEKAQPPSSDTVIIYGIVSDEASKDSIPGARIQIVENNRAIRNTNSAEDGSYQFSPYSARKISLKTSAKGYLDSYESFAVTDYPKQEFNIALTPLKGIALHLNNKTNRDYPLTTITATDLTTHKIVYHKELSNGIHNLDELTTGPYLLTAVSYDKQTTVTTRASAGDNAYITLNPFAKIDVILIMNNTGEPATKGEYRYIWTVDGNSSVMDWKPIPGGYFTIDNLKPGTYQIEARTKTLFENDSAHISKARPIHLEMGDTETIKLNLTENKTLRFRMTNLSKVDLSTGKFILLSQSEGGSTIATWDMSSNNVDNREFALEHTLPTGNFLVILQSKDGDVSAFYGTSNGDGEDVNIELDMGLSRKLSSDGFELSFKQPKSEDEFDSPEAYMAAEKEHDEYSKKWIEAIKEQAKWQNDENQKAQEREFINWEGDE